VTVRKNALMVSVAVLTSYGHPVAVGGTQPLRVVRLGAFFGCRALAPLRVVTAAPATGNTLVLAAVDGTSRLVHSRSPSSQGVSVSPRVECFRTPRGRSNSTIDQRLSCGRHPLSKPCSHLVQRQRLLTHALRTTPRPLNRLRTVAVLGAVFRFRPEQHVQ